MHGGRFEPPVLSPCPGDLEIVSESRSVWLSARGFAEVRTLVAGTEDLATLFKPGMLSSFIDENAGK